MTPKEILLSVEDAVDWPPHTIHVRLVDKALKALDAAGYVIVPKEATDEMLLAPGKPYGGELDLDMGLELRRQAWRQMLEAARR